MRVESYGARSPISQELPLNTQLSTLNFSMDNLRDAIKTMMVENLMLKVPKEDIGDDLPLFGPDGLGLDSIDALELVVSLEKQFGVTVPNSEAARQALTSVNSIHDYILAHRKS